MTNKCAVPLIILLLLIMIIPAEISAQESNITAEEFSSDELSMHDAENETLFVLPLDSILLLNFTEAKQSFTFLPQYVVTPNWFLLAILLLVVFAIILAVINDKSKKKKLKPKRKTGKFEDWPAKKPGGWPVKW